MSSTTCWVSVWSVFRNFKRAGTFQNRSRTSMRVPTGLAAALSTGGLPPSILMAVATSSWARRVTSVKRDTEAMDGKASPRKPNVPMATRSSAVLTLLVACLNTARRASSGLMPLPSSTTRTRPRPASSMSIKMRLAPASMAFSTSSLTTDAGRSTTSPAAIWLASASGRICTRALRSTPLTL